MDSSQNPLTQAFH